jgi:monoamine oxidase
MTGERNLSIGIVGGGIAGLYGAWKLADKCHTVSLFECLDDFGGRIETLTLDGHKAECGPMRFELNVEPRFQKLLKDLNITPAHFPATKAESAKFPLYLLNDDEKHTDQKKAEETVEAGLGASGAARGPKAFSLVGAENMNNVHICGEAYSGYQGFIEGALESATSVIEAVDLP